MSDPAPIKVEVRVELHGARVPLEDLARARRGELTLIRLLRCQDRQPGLGSIALPCEWCDVPCWVLPSTTAMRLASKIMTVAICAICLEHALLTPPAQRS